MNISTGALVASPSSLLSYGQFNGGDQEHHHRRRRQKRRRFGVGEGAAAALGEGKTPTPGRLEVARSENIEGGGKRVREQGGGRCEGDEEGGERGRRGWAPVTTGQRG